MVPTDFDWKNPDYTPIFQRRIDALRRIRQNPEQLPMLKAYYKANPADFIEDWGLTFDPRLVERGIPAYVPMMLFPKQREWVNWLMGQWKAQQSGLTEKSRDCGLSWLAVSAASTLCLFHHGLAIGFGSRKEEYCDKLDSPKSLFFKARLFMKNLPIEFRGGWDAKLHAPHMRLMFPETDSFMSAEAGDNIGRGDRCSIYFIDESAYLERPQLIDASLSATTNCRIDISSVNGMNNSFAQRRHGGKIPVFVFDWRDDPRKDDAWYAKQCDELDPVVVAAEIDRNYSASVEGSLIPSAWVQASIDAHKKLGITPSGARFGSLDVADEGRDKNAFCGAHGILIEHLEEWSGKGGDIFETVQKTFGLCDDLGYDRFHYDADGLGAGVRGDARVVNESRTRKLDVQAFRGSEAPLNPEHEDVKGRKNKDFFANHKAQAWWMLRYRFQATFRAVTEGMTVAPDDIISIPSTLPDRARLCTELSQPTYSINSVGKVVIDKAPDGMKSPNLADAVMIRFSQAGRRPMKIDPAVLARFSKPAMGMRR